MTRARLMESVQINLQREELVGSAGHVYSGMGFVGRARALHPEGCEDTRIHHNTPRKKAPPPSTSADSTSKSSAMAEVQSSRL